MYQHSPTQPHLKLDTNCYSSPNTCPSLIRALSEWGVTGIGQHYSHQCVCHLFARLRWPGRIRHNHEVIVPMFNVHGHICDVSRQTTVKYVGAILNPIGTADLIRVNVVIMYRNFYVIYNKKNSSERGGVEDSGRPAALHVN